MEQRLKLLRKKLGLTQEEFALSLGIKRSAISNYEIGRNEPIDAVVSLICREFGASEKWLRTGEGEMFVKRTEEDELTAAVERLVTGESAEFKRRLVKSLSTLKDGHWLLLEEKLKEIIGIRGASPDADTSGSNAKPGSSVPESDLAGKVAALEKQNRELEARNRKLEGEIEEYKAFGKQAEKLAISHAISEEKPESSASSASGSGAG